ncbi:M3 family metallopeptidase [Luteococcus sp. OSA5]|uniref:M3 family metallopeptidase n=1 Tax=Luteococcus sp. OSA5 TaxID=3401630 RepID=UPI003B439CF3
MSHNPLIATSSRPFGLPDFSAVRSLHYREAIELGMDEQRAEIEQIVQNPEAADVENTVVALERSGRTLKRASRFFFNQSAADSNDELRQLESELAPKLAAHSDAIRLDSALFERVAAVHAQLGSLDLDEETRRLVELTHLDFVMAGAALDDQSKQRLRELNQELSSLTTQFQRNLLADTNDSAVLFTDRAELDGLNEGQLSACAQAAAERGLEGWLVTHSLFTDHPYNAQLTCRESRRRIYEASIARCSRGNEHDNTALVQRITALRAERAGLLGHPNHVSAVLTDQTARTPEAIDQMIYPLAGPALANLQREAQVLQQHLDEHQLTQGEQGYPLQPWDWSYWAEQVRAERYDVDTAALRPWFSYEKVLVDGVFWAATQLFGITFGERSDMQTYHPDARAFEVFDHDGSLLGLFIHDVFTRDSKRGGAWMNNLVDQNHLFDELPVICNNLNVPKPAPGEPVLLSMDEVVTMFHEFGHALHGLLSEARYPSLSGTHVPRDFVEFPSQVNEMWITWPEVVNHYARHHETGEPIAQEVLERLETSKTFNEGFATTEYLASALLDQEWHRIAPGAVVEDVMAFEQEALERIGLANPLVLPRYRSTYFSHTFAGGYDARYYCYLFSEVMDADTVEWFKENGGLTRANGDHFRRTVLARGNTRDPLESFRELRGRDAEIAPLLARRGLSAQ